MHNSVRKEVKPIRNRQSLRADEAWYPSCPDFFPRKLFLNSDLRENTAVWKDTIRIWLTHLSARSLNVYTIINCTWFFFFKLQHAAYVYPPSVLKM